MNNNYENLTYNDKQKRSEQLIDKLYIAYANLRAFHFINQKQENIFLNAISEILDCGTDELQRELFTNETEHLSILSEQTLN